MSTEAPLARADARKTHPAPGDRARTRSLPLGQMESSRKRHCRERGTRLGRPLRVGGGKGSHEGHARGPTYTLSSLAASYTPTVMVR